MWGLLISTVVTSAADSLNPIAITQQFVLQGMVKKPRHIWYFILPTGITNLIGGFLAYYGLVAVIGHFFGGIISKYGRMLFAAELILGTACLVAAGLLIQNGRIKALESRVKVLEGGGAPGAQEEAAKKIKSVTPAALVALGVGATISELATALPYFAFLAILFNYQLTFLQVALILVVYNTIYTLPLAILYFVYIKARHRFDRFYGAVAAQAAKWGNILGPAVAGMIGVALMCHGLWNLVP